MAKKNIDTTTMGGRIQALRLQKGWSQEELSFKIGVNKKSVISEYENDKRAVTLPILPVLAKELGTTIDYLVSGASEEEDPDVEESIREVRNRYVTEKTENSKRKKSSY